jgi:ABC-type branched-subunit amino acid transport system substrate-binding protein
MRCFLLLVMFALAGCANGTAPPVIVVGHVSDKTRPDKAGDQAELGIRLALHELDKDDALSQALGGRKIQVNHTDTRGNLDAFEAEAVRLEAINRAVAILGGQSAKEIAALDHVKTPILTLHGQPVSGAGKHVFYLGMIPGRQGMALAKIAAENAKLKRIVVLIDERLPEAPLIAESFTSTFNESRKDAAMLSLRFGKDAKWPELTERIVAHEAQAVVFAGLADDFNACNKSLRRDAFLSVDLIFAGPDGSQRTFDVELSAKQSVLLATVLNPDPAFEKVASFRKAYREAFQVEADVNAALAYDGFRVLIEAIKQVHPQPFAADRLREELLKIKDFGDGVVTGPLTITPDRQVQRPLYVARWRDGTLTPVKKFDPAP